MRRRDFRIFVGPICRSFWSINSVLSSLLTTTASCARQDDQYDVDGFIYDIWEKIEVKFAAFLILTPLACFSRVHCQYAEFL